MNTQKELSRAVELHKQGKVAEAEKIYRAVLEAEPNNAAAIHMLGVIDFEAGRIDVGIEQLEKALKLSPNNPFILHNLGNMYGVIGKMEAAGKYLFRAIELKPDYYEAFHSIVDHIKFTRDHPLFPLLYQALDKVDQMSSRDQCFILFAAGKMHDDIGEYDKAFDYYHRGNKAKHARYDLIRYEKFNQDIMEKFTPELYKKLQDAANPTESLIFIVGMPRCGSTLIEKILAAHPKVFGMGEIADIHFMAHAIQRYVPGHIPFPQNLSISDPKVLTSLGQNYLAACQKRAPDAEFYVNKTLSNYRYLGFITLLYPNAKIIHAQRHPLDSCLSTYFKNFKEQQEYTFDMEILAKAYASYCEMMDFWQRELPIPILAVKYEDLIADQEIWTRKILDFCGLEWDDRCLEFYKSRQHVQTASLSQVRKPIYKTSVHRYKHYEKHLDVWKEILKKYIGVY